MPAGSARWLRELCTMVGKRINVGFRRRRQAGDGVEEGEGAKCGVRQHGHNKGGRELEVYRDDARARGWGEKVTITS